MGLRGLSCLEWKEGAGLATASVCGGPGSFGISPGLVPGAPRKAGARDSQLLVTVGWGAGITSTLQQSSNKTCYQQLQGCCKSQMLLPNEFGREGQSGAQAFPTHPRSRELM